jgi:hypothetical protein
MTAPIREAQTENGRTIIIVRPFFYASIRAAVAVLMQHHRRASGTGA